MLGPQGAGLAAGLGLDADLIMGTFSKSLASCGGFILGPLDVIDYLRTACRPFFMTGSVNSAHQRAVPIVSVTVIRLWRRSIT